MTANQPVNRVGSEVLFVNDRVRVWAMRLEAGETCAWHQHRNDYLMLYPEAAIGRSSARSQTERVEPGFVAFAVVGSQGLAPHQITNLGQRPVTHYIVELLGPSAAETAQPPAHNGRIHLDDHVLADSTRAETSTTTAPADRAPVGGWKGTVSFVGGPREGEQEVVQLTFLPDGVIIHAEVSVESGRIPRGIGEWTAEADRFSYWFNVVLGEPTGKPGHVVHVRGEGAIMADGQTFHAHGAGEVYGAGGDLLVAHSAELVATRAEAS